MTRRRASRSGRRTASRSALVTLVTALAVAVAAFACTTRTPATAPPAPQPGVGAGGVPVVAVVDPVGPTSFDHGVGVGWRHDAAGAEAAAAAFVEASRLVATAGPLGRRDVILAIATRDYGPALVEATNRQLDDLFFELGDRGVHSKLVWSEHALTVDTTVSNAEAAEVQVWSVLVVAVSGGSVARQVWRTSTLELRWEGGDWKVDRWSTRPGPLPAPPPEAAASSVAEIAAAASWRPASSGGAS